MGKKITKTYLEGIGACSRGITWFCRKYPKGVQATARGLRSERREFVVWLAEMVIPERTKMQLWKTYEDAVAPLLKTYSDAVAPLLETDRDVEALLWKTYSDAMIEKLIAHWNLNTKKRNKSHG